MIVGPKILDRMLEAHRKALQDLAIAHREANTLVSAELKAMTSELKSVSNQVLRLVITLAAIHPDIAKDLARTLGINPNDPEKT